jgi:hypothetical protein
MVMRERTFQLRHKFTRLVSAVLLRVCLPLLGVAPSIAEAQVRISEGTFEKCQYGNRGGECRYRDDKGQEAAIPLPHKPAKELQWYVDNRQLGYVPMDGGFFVPDHPAFAEDHFVRFDSKGDHPLYGCKIRVIERPGETKIMIDTNQCSKN